MTQSSTTTGGRDVMDVRTGLPAPMGSTPDVGGTKFAVYSVSATEGCVSMCLFGDDGTETRVPVARPSMRCGRIPTATRAETCWPPALGSGSFRPASSIPADAGHQAQVSSLFAAAGFLAAFEAIWNG
jgi:hypothetical protein